MEERKNSKTDSPLTAELQVIACPNIGNINVHIQGNRSSGEVVILTVHDLGCDHSQYREFTEHPRMGGIRSRTVWVGVEVPGQGQDQLELAVGYQFPSMQQIGKDIIHVLDQLKLKEVICLGEGAGANILARFAMAHSERVLGLCLMHATGTTAGLFESMKDKMVSWKVEKMKLTQSAESYLLLHRFGEKKFSKVAGDDIQPIMESFQEALRSRANPRNLKLFVDAFHKRTSIVDGIKKITCPMLLVTGQYSIFNTATRNLHQSIMKECKDKTKVEFIEVAGVANVLEEKPDKLIECFQYFLQGLGVVSAVPMQNVAMPVRGRSMSMQEYDLPLRQRLFSAQLSSTPPIFDPPINLPTFEQSDEESPQETDVTPQQQPPVITTN